MLLATHLILQAIHFSLFFLTINIFERVIWTFFLPTKNICNLALAQTLNETNLLIVINVFIITQ